VTNRIKLSPEAARFVDDRVHSGDCTDPDSYVNELVLEKARQVADYEGWFRGKVLEGIAAAECGEFATDDEVEALFRARR
jgi:predicted transcriptional regulator